MKVFLATLFFVGFAAAVPCPILEKLKTQLQKGVQDLKEQTEVVIRDKGASIEEDIATIAKNPYRAADDLKMHANDVAMILYYNEPYNEITRGIEAAISELKEVDPKLVKPAVYPILDILKEHLTRNYKFDNRCAWDLTNIARVLYDEAKYIDYDPAKAPKMQEKVTGEWSKFVNNHQEYTRKTEQLVNDTLKRIEELYQE